MGRRILIHGTGKASSSLAGALSSAGATLVGVVSRDPQRAKAWAKAHGVMPVAVHEPLPAADILFVLTEDGAIADEGLRLAAVAQPGLVWAHMAGSLAAELLEPAARRAGGGELLAFHPLAVLDGSPRTLAGAVVTLQGTGAGVAAGRELARALGARPVAIRAEDKAAYHLAACLASGQLIGVVAAAAHVAAKAGLPSDVADGLVTLAQEALRAAGKRGLANALTGPLVRGDRETVANHLHWLGSQDEQDGAVVRAVYDAAGLAALRFAVDAGGAASEAVESVRAALIDDWARTRPQPR